ncbi:class I adenylate-forming enzyme family protein [Diaphorobacter sp. HDW4B]|uniref:class I adenylate-forming enzyme family protein n=1 Tax=Diaphorobacter sp. HDW4B TaxID=2714925 RepID=UPI001F112E4A|nr:AMP-binding protein [Diaphorobacter sp. HDW4B]
MFHALRSPQSVALSDDSGSLGFADLCARARALSVHLDELGVRRGDRVAVFMNNSMDYLALMHATAYSGFSIVPVNTRYSAHELAFLVSDCTPRVLVYDTQFATIVSEMCDMVSELDRPVCISDLEPGLHKAAASDDPVMLQTGVVDDDDVAIIMYTSGTTSSPKGAMLTHGNLVWNSVNYILELGLDAQCRSLMATPLFHIGGFGVLNGPILYAGGGLHVVPRFDAQTVIDDLQTVQPTHVFLLSAMWVSITDHPGFSSLRMPEVRYVQTAAAPLGEWRQELIRKVFPNAEFGWGFGMTESCVTTIKNRYSREILEHPGSVGFFWRHIAHRLVDEEGVTLSNQNGPGELQVKGPTVFKGYWNQPELTAETITADGWLKTGDLFRIDGEGYAYFVGRSKDMVKTGGENVAALEVENCLAAHEDVREAAVFGVPNEKWGEELVAAVVPIAGRTPDAEALRTHCRQRLSGFKVPKRIVLVDSLPHSSSGKIQKFKLKQGFTA